MCHVYYNHPDNSRFSLHNLSNGSSADAYSIERISTQRALLTSELL